MKKIIALATLAGIIAIGAQTGKSLKYQEDTNNGTSSCTNYYGWAWATDGSTSPSDSDARWKIVRTVLDSSGNVTAYQHAYSTPSFTGGNPLWSNTWTNRVSVTYK